MMMIVKVMLMGMLMIMVATWSFSLSVAGLIMVSSVMIENKM